jgi:hypothetical protein
MSDLGKSKKKMLQLDVTGADLDIFLRCFHVLSNCMPMLMCLCFLPVGACMELRA